VGGPKAAAAPVGSPWMWTLALGYDEDRTPDARLGADARRRDGGVRKKVAAGVITKEKISVKSIAIPYRCCPTVTCYCGIRRAAASAEAPGTGGRLLPHRYTSSGSFCTPSWGAQDDQTT